MPQEEQRHLPHIYLPGHGNREDLRSPRSGGGSGAIPERNRQQHAQRLEEMLTAAVAAAEDRIINRDPTIRGGTPGFYLEFELPQTQQAVLDKLENKQGKQHIELVAARPSTEGSDLLKATVFVPESRREHYLRKVRAYANEDSVRYKKDEEGNYLLDEKGNRLEKSRRPKNQALVAALETANLGEVLSLYTDDSDIFPKVGKEVWWEVWLRPERRTILDHAADQLQVTVREHTVSFVEREVVLARASPETIGRIVANTDAIAELRLARDTPSFFIEMEGAHQIAWAQELAERIVPPKGNAPAVCLLDSGSTRRHPLIIPALTERDLQAWHVDLHGEDVSAQWNGHGTQMSGVVLYGDLVDPNRKRHC